MLLCEDKFLSIIFIKSIIYLPIFSIGTLMSITTTFSLPVGQWVKIAQAGDGPFYFSADCNILYLSDGPATPNSNASGITLTANKTLNINEKLSDGECVWILTQKTNNGFVGTLTLVKGAQATVRAAQPKEAKYALIGDSQMGLGNSPVALTAINNYDSVTGILDLQVTSHGLQKGTYIGFQVLGFPQWNNYKVAIFDNLNGTRFDANNFSINIGAGLGLTGTTPFNSVESTSLNAARARWFKFGTMSGQGINGWIQHLTEGRLRRVRAAGVTGDVVQNIAARLDAEIFSVLSPGDTLIINGMHNNIAIAFSISAASWSNGISTITTSSVHNFNTGDEVNISQVTPSGYNGNVVVTVISSTQFSFVLASTPGTYVSGGVVLYTAQTIYNYIYNNVKTAVDYGLNVILLNGSPFGATYAANTILSRQLISNTNRMFSDIPLQLPGVAYIDVYNEAVDQTLTTLSGTSGAGTGKTNWIYTDNLHYGPLLSKAIAVKIKDVFNVWYPPVNRLITSGFDSYDATNNPTSLNLFGNAGLTTVTGGTVTGLKGGSVLGTNWTGDATANATSITASVGQASWTTRWLGNTGKLTGDANLTFAAGSRVRFLLGGFLTRLSPNDEFIVRAYLKTSGLAGAISYVQNTIYMQVDSQSSITINGALGFASNLPQYYPNTEFDGYVESAIQKVPNGTAVTQLLVEFAVFINTVDLASNQLPSTFFIELGQVSIEKIRAV